MTQPLVVDPRLTIPAADLAWTAVRGSGPGGQNVNKVASKVELRFDLPGTAALEPLAKLRLAELARSRLDAEGKVRVVSQRTRDQLRNLEDARGKLSALIQQALVPPVARKKAKVPRRMKERRLSVKRLLAAKKRDRRGGPGDEGLEQLLKGTALFAGFV